MENKPCFSGIDMGLIVQVFATLTARPEIYSAVITATREKDPDLADFLDRNRDRAETVSERFSGIAERYPRCGYYAVKPKR